MNNREKNSVQLLLDKAGIKINGHHPWDIQVHDERLYNRILAQGSLGLGEAYMAGWWDAEALDEFFTRVLQADLGAAVANNLPLVLTALQARVMNRQSKLRAFEIGEAHYDIGNDLFTAMLDKRLTYTCGYYKDAQDLDAAQEAKLDLVCKKLNLKAGQTILDIGCGWGSFLKYAAEKYGVKGVGITVSKEQQTLAQKLCTSLDIEIRLQDYRDIADQFNHIVSLGMFEHVGYKNYHTYMEVVNRCLKDNGLFLLHTIGGNKSVHGTDPWIEKYIFPNSMLPSVAQIGSAIEGLFVLEDWHSFGAYYDTTLMAWFENFDAAWPTLKQNPTYTDKFYRMWKYYLLSCASSFRSRSNQLWQVVLSKHGVPGGYQSVR